MEREKKRRRRWAAPLLAVLAALSVTVGGIAFFQKKVLEVPYISQEGSLATGCELVSATMLLNYYGYNVTVEQVVERTPKGSLKQTARGLTGPHPAERFIGDPHSSNGFGCYAPVVVSVLNSFFKEGGEKQAQNLTGTDLETLVRSHIMQDRPVLVWATMEMRAPKPGKSWTVESTGRPFQWVAGEHCLVLVGFDRDQYYFNDPYESNGMVPYPKDLVEKRYAALGRQAMAVTDRP